MIITKSQLKIKEMLATEHATALGSLLDKFYSEDAGVRAAMLPHVLWLAAEGYSYSAAAKLAGRKLTGAWQRIYQPVVVALTAKAAGLATEADAILTAFTEISITNAGEVAAPVYETLVAMGETDARKPRKVPDTLTKIERFLAATKKRLENADNGKVKNLPRFNALAVFPLFLSGRPWREILVLKDILAAMDDEPIEAPSPPPVPTPIPDPVPPSDPPTATDAVVAEKPARVRARQAAVAA